MFNSMVAKITTDYFCSSQSFASRHNWKNSRWRKVWRHSPRNFSCQRRKYGPCWWNSKWVILKIGVMSMTCKSKSNHTNHRRSQRTVDSHKNKGYYSYSRGYKWYIIKSIKQADLYCVICVSNAATGWDASGRSRGGGWGGLSLGKKEDITEGSSQRV